MARADARVQRKQLEEARKGHPLDQPETKHAIQHAGYFARMEATYPLNTGEILGRIRIHAQEIAILAAAVDPPAQALDALADLVSPGSAAHIAELFGRGNFSSEHQRNKSRRAALALVLREHARKAADGLGNVYWLRETQHPGRDVYRVIQVLRRELDSLCHEAQKTFGPLYRDIKSRARNPPKEFESDVLPAESEGGGRRPSVSKVWAWYAADYLRSGTHLPWRPELGAFRPWNDRELAALFQAIGVDDLGDYHAVADLRKLIPQRRMRARLRCPMDEYY